VLARAFLSSKNEHPKGFGKPEDIPIDNKTMLPQARALTDRRE